MKPVVVVKIDHLRVSTPVRDPRYKRASFVRHTQNRCSAKGWLQGYYYRKQPQVTNSCRFRPNCLSHACSKRLVLVRCTGGCIRQTHSPCSMSRNLIIFFLPSSKSRNDWRHQTVCNPLSLVLARQYGWQASTGWQLVLPFANSHAVERLVLTALSKHQRCRWLL